MTTIDKDIGFLVRADISLWIIIREERLALAVTSKQTPSG